MLTDQELNRIFSWLPYRSDWPANGNQIEGNIENYFGPLLSTFRNNEIFKAYEPQDGGTSNFLEFICYPKEDLYNGNAIAVYISFCAPIACYGQTQFFTNEKYSGHNFLKPEMVGVVTDENLKTIEEEITAIINDNQLTLINQEFANRILPQEIVDKMKNNNLNFGDKYLHGLFQWMD
jgi:hypothetical protein